MSAELVIELVRHALTVALMVAAPLLLTSLVVGVVVSLVQAVTQVQEQTLSFVPKIVVTFLSVIICSTWIGGMLGAFALKIFSYIPNLVVK